MDKYGLIGYPLGHSFSKNYFNEKFENEGIDAQYINFEIPSIENLTEILDSNPELKGLNVTIPYKEKVISYLDVVSPEANAIGAVNVIKVEHRGKMFIRKDITAMSSVLPRASNLISSLITRRLSSWVQAELQRLSTSV